eukprot:Blabericola_migrator_1__8711@NODE_458_length_8301_cov_106_163469_g359_i0_p7_GENE_NODE_458_length_8301_cov_106_163469_g359_i0NODE_458_length_8301_cov_106_163469_g359_i0_p7_ORF_typecomplete_len128_score9_99Rep_facA_3/PF08661_11/9_1e17_NODE_458_length_8301_cov_106_163469_g359_i013601743
MQEGGLCAPRVNGEMLKRHLSTDVSVVGKVDDWSTNSLTLSTSDGRSVVCLISKEIQPANTQFVLVTGNVATSESLSLANPTHFVVPLGDSIDLSIADQAIVLAYHPQVRELFELQQPQADVQIDDR